MATMSFKNYVLSGRFNKVASEAVADAIARTKAQGLPVEVYPKTQAAKTPAPQRGSSTPTSANNAKKKPLTRAA